MPKLNIADLEKLREAAKSSAILREGGPFRAKITVHMGTCGIAAGAREIMENFLRLLNENKLPDVLLTTSGCAGMCSREPIGDHRTSRSFTREICRPNARESQSSFRPSHPLRRTSPGVCLGLGK